MIIGIGVDIVDINRIRETDSNRLAKRILSKDELNNYHSFQNEERKLTYLCGRFAAKEAYSKALGTGIGKIGFADIEVLNDDLGKPYIVIDSEERQAIHLSISHTDSHAIAFVTIECF